MDENNIFKNEEDSFELPKEPASDQTEENNLFANAVVEDVEKNIIPEDVEIDLDPALSDSNTNYQEKSQSTYTDNSQIFNEVVVEPIAPIMPQIEKTDYIPTERSTTGKGVKVFATIIALMVVVSACITGGYYFGKNTTNKNVTVDLASKPAAKDALTISQVYEKTAPSVVGIYVYNEEDGISSTATGVIYSKDGYIITNDHIYDGVASAKFKIYTHDKKMYSAQYVAGDTRSDLAVLKVTDAQSSSFVSAELGNSDQTVVGESVVAIGRPNGATNSSIASEGIVSAVSTRVSTTSSYTSSLIQTDSAINPGNSGGALCNIYGQVIGITSAKLVGNEYDGIGYAIPSTTVKKIVDSLIKNKTVKNRAKLGISYRHIDELTSELLKLPCGLQIEAIDKSCGLYGKSVELKDIITHVNGAELTDSNIILDIIETSAPGDSLNLKIYSVENKKSIDITVKLLEDIGSSSYTTQKQNSNKNDSNNSNKEYNSSEFSFPNGE